MTTDFITYKNTMKKTTCAEMVEVVSELYLADTISTEEYDAFSWVLDIALEELGVNPKP